MASILKASPQLVTLPKNTTTPSFIHHSSFPILHFPPHRNPTNSAPKSSSSSSSSSSRKGRVGRSSRHDAAAADANSENLLRRPVVSPPPPPPPYDKGKDEELKGKNEEEKEGESHWVALEDQILEDTVPLINIVRHILHSSIYRSGERLSPQHEKLILERLLPYHPEYQVKIGCGIDYITVGYHPDFESSRCLFIVQKDGELVDFSYWKCIKGLMRKNYPSLTDGYIFKQIRQQWRNE